MRDYRQYVREHYQKYCDEFWNPGATPAPDKPKHKDCWGSWWYDQSNFTLVLENWQKYYIDLSQCNDSAQVTDWIFQIAGKTWATPELLGYLIQALRDLLHPQQNLCSYGRSKTMDVVEYLRAA